MKFLLCSLLAIAPPTQSRGLTKQYLPAPSALTSSGAAFTASWSHDPDLEGPLQPIAISIKVERWADESGLDWAERCSEAVHAASAVFPPNAP